MVKRRKKRTVYHLKWPAEPAFQDCGNKFWVSTDGNFMIVCGETYYGIPMVKEYTVWERRWSQAIAAVDWWPMQQDRSIRSWATAKKLCEKRRAANLEAV